MKDIIFTFADGEEIGVWDGQSVRTLRSAFITNYKTNAEGIARSKAWKTSGSGAVFRESYHDPAALTFDGQITGAYPAGGGEVIYSFKIDNSSGIYRLSACDDKLPESHIINSVELSFGCGSYNAASGELAASVARSYYNSDIALFNCTTGDYKTITEGDTADEDPFICDDNSSVIYYSSRAVGRDAHGEFVEYAPSAIYKLDLSNMSLEEVASSQKFSYFRPVVRGGELYAIKSPVKSANKGNALLDIVLIPYRILQAIAGFISLFVNVFAGKSITSSGANPAKGRNYDSRKIKIAGNLIDVEKEAKRNAKKKDSDYGIVPSGWKLVNLTRGEELASGVAAFDIAPDGSVYYTNGRRIFCIKDGKRSKICNTSMCLHINCVHNGEKSGDLFGI